MGKFKLSSWLHPSSPTAAEADQKKQNRRSFPGFSTSSAKMNGERLSSQAQTETANGAPPAQSTSEMIALAQKITRETEKLQAYMTENNLPMPSFEVDAANDFPKLPSDIHRSRQEIIFATKQLRDLAIGPRESIRWGVWDFLDVLALQIINKYGIAKLVPIEGTITLTELQSKTPLDPVNLARVIRMATANHIFAEPSPGVIAHTASSRLLAEDDDLRAWVGFNAEDIFPASAHVLQALQSDPAATSLVRAGFQFAFGTADQEPMFVTFGRDPERARRMGRAMASLTGGEGYEVRYLVDGYDFSDVDAAGGTLVDVGGSHGFVCVDLARKYRRMRFVVQDLQKTVDSAPRPVCEDAQVAERISFQAYDFFTPQVVEGADVYFFRWIMHNYSTPYAVKILKNLVPALKPGARVVINDHCLREPGLENPWDERIMRRMDMVMLALLNAQERTEDEFRELFRAADEGFVFKGVTRPEGCRMSIVEAVWKPDEVQKEASPAAVEEGSTANTPAAAGGDGPAQEVKSAEKTAA
ncbi:O-methyltransferase [Pleurostoma richardsiae]|uniref:O-methyltransferase n=1 Tax=Pleurostoma richardsiae TaxID=41990 RepID=A0AA38S3M1_9PEZI|nr:O-methyltransferase [Pleurostoma richardsiae]